MTGKFAGRDLKGSGRPRKKSRRASLKRKFSDDLPALIRPWKVRLSVRHLHGPRKVVYGKDELLILCLVRNAQTYIESFIEHYLSMGAKHIVFLDNGSEDETVSIARNHERVTVLQTKLSFKKYRLEMKQYLVYRFGRDRWSLSVDQDELFDYPYSDVVSLKSLLGYLNERRYTTIVTHLLDMFPDRPLSSRANPEDGALKERYRFYDLSGIEKEEYNPGTGARKSNAVSNEDIKVYRGGIRKTLFGAGASLTKHPLTFFAGGVKPLHGSSHITKHARVADFSCVLYHYKFIDGFREHAEWAIREDAYPSRPSGRHEKYVEAMDQDPEMKISRYTSRELGSVNDLVDNGFLAVSDEYAKWANAENPE